MPKSHTGRAVLDRRSAILAGTAFVGAAAIPDAVGGAAEPGLAPAADLPRCRAQVPGEPRARQAQGRYVRLGRARVAQLELLRRRRLHQAGPQARADERRAEGGGLGPARHLAVAGRHRQDEERHAAAGRAGGQRQRRRPALLASGSRSPSSARRPRPARGASASRATTSPSRSPCATTGSCRSRRPRSRRCPTASPAERMPAW